MTFELRIFIGEHSRGHHAWNHWRFAVVDLNKSRIYPENFVSMLPMKLYSDMKIPSAFATFFGNKSLKTARGLLTEALKKEHCSGIKAEIERRLNLLEPNPVIHIRCRVCRKFFKTSKEEARKQKVCPECMKRFDRKELTEMPIAKKKYQGFWD
ncbi:hypothetical protein JXA31_04705 [Candidatus Bathyarchaeota archaeon]|nr:hypothetical protein [Candidatus Bathyarchaeota archaeon]